MIKDYLNEILDGKKTCDVRSYPTSIRGKIALLDSRSMKIYGTVDLIDCREISAEEYCLWHQAGRFKNYVFQIDDKNKKFYAYDFKNPEWLAKPIRIEVEKHTWVKIPDGIEFEYAVRLF